LRRLCRNSRGARRVEAAADAPAPAREFRAAEWSEINLDKALWTVPAARMKRLLVGKLNGAPHLVPLPKQAAAVLRELQPLTGGGTLVFRGERHHDPTDE